MPPAYCEAAPQKLFPGWGERAVWRFVLDPGGVDHAPQSPMFDINKRSTLEWTARRARLTPGLDYRKYEYDQEAELHADVDFLKPPVAATRRSHPLPDIHHVFPSLLDA